ncbi:ricin-type beta-trefoil lectin domain protein [Streptacidiphilus sp. N1-3]|uniref:Ricin-type beta-trefoil lectin domain protein n=1 Tax=Streptacidiphilus alkalitolerans TaxID=3342712 RepID=A0ABV6WWG5_9ACTN
MFSGSILGRRLLRATAVVTLGALAWSMAAGSAAAVTPDWNLGNTQQSQISDINAQASGTVRNAGLGKCLDDLGGKTTNGTTVDSSTCNATAPQNWTYTPAPNSDAFGSVTLTGSPGKCLDITSTNGGEAKSVAMGGTTQMLLTTSGELYAKSSIGMGGWTKEADSIVLQIAAGSDGTQMMVGSDGAVYARSSIGATSGWVKEIAPGAIEIATNGGVQMILGSGGIVYARTGIGAASDWTAESAAGAKAIAVGSDGTQMMIGSDGAVYARSSIGATSGWVKEIAPGAKEIATNGGVQMIVGSDGNVYARTGIALNGWTKESGATIDPTFTSPIAADADGTQIYISTDKYAYARTGIGSTAWTKEGGSLSVLNYGTSIAGGAGGAQTVILSTGVVDARTGIGSTNWTVESDLTNETSNNSPVQLTDCNNWKSQQWIYQRNQIGSVQLYNPTAGRCVDTPSSSTADGTALQIYTCNGSIAQQFNPPAAAPAPSGPITDNAMNKCAVPASTMATAAVGTAVVLFSCGVGYKVPTCTTSCVTGPVLPWSLNADGTVTAAGLCLGVTGGETVTADGTLVQLAKCASSLDQQWVVGFDTGGAARLVNPNSGRCLDDPTSSITNGTQLRIWTCNNTAAQQWSAPHAGHAFVGPATVTTSTLAPGTGDINTRDQAMKTAATERDVTAHLALLLHAGGIKVRTAAAQALAGPSSALTTAWYGYEQGWVDDPSGPLAQDVADAATADHARVQRANGAGHFLDSYWMLGYAPEPDDNADVTNFMSKDSTYRLAMNAAEQALPVTHADQAAKDKVTAIAAAHAAQDPSEAWKWNMYRDHAINGSADDVRRFIQYDGWPTVAPVAGTPEFRVEVESLKARWAGGDPTNPLDPNDVLIDAEETAWAEWQAELNGQAQPRADLLADEMQALDALKAGAETMHDGLDYAWTAGGILWAQGQKTTGDPVIWSGVDMSQAPHNLGLIKAKVAALASAAQNEAAVAQDAANKADAALTSAYATALVAGLPEGRGLTYALQSAQVTKSAAAAAQATSNAMQTAVAATNATLADSATLLANASAQAHAARALYLRETAQDNAASAAVLATQAQNQAKAAATAAAVVAADKAKIATVEATAKDAQDRADAAAADAAKQRTIAANAKATAQTQRDNAAAADAAAQQQAATAAARQADAATAASRAADDDATAQQSVSDASAAESRAQIARNAMDAALTRSAAADAAAAAAAGTSAAADADAAAAQARSDANAAAIASDQANTDANHAESAAAAARAAATVANAAADKANSDAATADAAAEQTHAAARKADSLAADAIVQAAAAAQDAAAAQATAKQAGQDSANAKAAAVAAQTEAAGALSDSATATGQALATSQAALAAAAEASTVAAPADQAIDLAAPYASTDSAAGLSLLSSEAAKTMAQQQADVAAADATQAAALAAAAQDAANRAAGDAKLAAQAAADAAASASKAAASASAAMASAAQAAADAKSTKQADDRVNAMDAQATQDATDATASAQAASSDAATASGAATAGEADADDARDAADDAAGSADAASQDADDAAASAADAQQAAATAQADAATAQQMSDALTQLQQDNPQPGQVTDSGPSGIADVFTKQVITKYSFTPTSDCVGSGGCDVTGNYHIEGYNVYLLVSCVTPSPTDAETCINTGSGPQVNVDVLGVVPLAVPDHQLTIHITQQELLSSTLKALPGILFGEYIGCAERLTGNGGSLGDCAWVVAELAAPKAISIIAKGARDLRFAIAAGDVTGINSALAALSASAIDSATLLKLESAARLAKAKDIIAALDSCFTIPHSFAAGTAVLMADGSTRPIQDVRVGDLVENATPGGGVQVHRVDQTHLTRTDTSFTDLTVDTPAGASTITGTQNHPYYDLTRKAFVDAGRLTVGDRLQTTGGSGATVLSVRDYTGSMATYDLTIDGVHTYYVVAGTTPVLVHNIDCGPALKAAISVPGLSSLWTDSNRLTIEAALGGNLVKGYPYIDVWDAETATATSVKSIDLRYDSYRFSNSTVTGAGKRYVDDMVNFRRNGTPHSDPAINPGMVKNYVLRLAFPDGATEKQLAALQKVVDYGATKGITVFLHPIAG